MFFQQLHCGHCLGQEMDLLGWRLYCYLVIYIVICNRGLNLKRKKAILTDASAKGRGSGSGRGGRPPSAKKCKFCFLTINKILIMFLNERICKNILWSFARLSVKNWYTFSIIFFNFWSIFPLQPKCFFYLNHFKIKIHLRPLLFKNIYIYICI